MTQKEYNFVKTSISEQSISSVLDVGSYDVNGSLKDLFNCEYIGVDMREGRNVDIVVNAHSLPFDNNRFDCVVCCSMFEHDDKFWLSANELIRVLAPNGIGIITMPSISFPRHDYPSDYWRATADGLKTLFPNASGYNDEDFAYIIFHK